MPAERNAREVPPISAATLRFFQFIVRRYFKRHFRAVMVQHSERLAMAHGPLIVYANHSSWWDPMVSILLAQTLQPTRKHYAPMDAAALAKYPILRKLGIFPVDLTSPRGAAQFLRTSQAILAAGGVVWITPQGRFADPRETPLHFKPGLGALALRVPGITLLPLAIEYTFWDERLPETLLHLGKPVQLDTTTTAAETTEQLEAALTRAMSALKAAACARDASAFQLILTGQRGTGGLYALGRRLHSIFTRKPISLDHTEREQPVATGGEIAVLILVCLSFAIFLCAVVPAALFCVNLRRYRAPLQPADVSNARVAVLIPARDEENNIAACLESVLASRGIELELYVLDDASTDNTAAIVERFAVRDARVKLITTQQLPAGWNGKQHACWLLAGATDAPYLFFLDADVRIAPDALSRCLSELQRSRVALLSGFPRQVTIGWLEQLLLPLIQFVLLAYLPMGRMRTSTKPAYAAGCGQFFLAERSAYFATGGHSAIRETRHDGLRLPQLFRRYGYRTDIVDLTTLADVRMYTSASAVWMGLAKNATEGLAAPARIVPLTLILALGQIAPALAASLWLATYSSMIVTGATFDAPLQAAAITALLTVAVIAMYLPRLMAIRRFQQPWLSALLHPFGVATLLALQWYALGKQLLRSPVAWRSRSYATGSGEEIQ